MCEVEAFDEDLRGFSCTRTCVVKEQKKKAVALSLRTLEVGSREEDIDLSLFQINSGRLRAFLERYEADILTPYVKKKPK